MAEQRVLQFGAPGSVPQLVWMVGLIPVAFFALGITFVGYAGACLDGCAQAPVALLIVGGAWTVGAGAWLATLLVSATRVSLVIATVGFAAPAVVLFTAALV